MRALNNYNPFEVHSGSVKVTSLISMTAIGCGTLIIAFLISHFELMGAFGLLGLLSAGVFLYIVFSYPKFGIIAILFMGFFANGLSRYIQIPWGLSVDGLLVLIYLALFFKGFRTRLKWSRARSGLTLVVSVWMFYVASQLINPEAVSLEAWFYAMRGLAMYQWMMIPLAFLLFNKPKDLRWFFIVWGILSVIGTLKGMQQFFFGVDPFEQRWLNEGGAQTHVLFGKLRIFSFYSDAGQFGASQAHAAVVFGILTLHIKHNIRLRLFFAAVALAGLYGMVISGTRGAIAVPAIGGVFYLILRRNVAILSLGAVLGIAVYIFFAHTTIGQGNAEIRRMRTAFDPNEASLQVRLENQKKLKGYMVSRPFGGGVGSGVSAR